VNGLARKAAFLAAGFALLFGLAISRAAAQSAAAQLAAAEPSSKTAEEVYENIVVFRDVPYGQLIPAMQLMSEQLGVDCEFCHDAQDRALEAKPAKHVARKMVQMVSDINKNTFGGALRVTCYSCHRGHAKPIDHFVFSDSESESPSVETEAAGKPASMPSLDQILDKYVTALGGAAAMQKISSRVEKGTLSTTQPGRPQVRLPVETFAKAPNKRFTKGFSVTHLGNSPGAFGVYNGNAGWLRESTGPVRLMFGWRRDAAKLEDTLNFPVQLKQILQQLRIEPAEKIGDREAHVVSGRTPFLALVKLYFDKDSGLLMRLLYYVETVVGSMPSQIDYADYRDVGGLKIPFRRTVTLVRGVRATYEIDEVQHNIPIDDSKFTIPAPLPSLYR
jgi:hypothetical protein